MSKPGRGSGGNRPTHQWLKPMWDYLDKAVEATTPSGASGIPNGSWLGRQVVYSQVGNASGIVGLYGGTGIAGQLATGTAGLQSGAAGATALAGSSGFGATGIGASGLFTFLNSAAFNGGTGNYYTLNDVVTALKNTSVLKP